MMKFVTSSFAVLGAPLCGTVTTTSIRPSLGHSGGEIRPIRRLAHTAADFIILSLFALFSRGR
jgi:hypothetical protein